MVHIPRTHVLLVILVAHVLSKAEGLLRTAETGDERLRNAVFGSGRRFSQILPKIHKSKHDPLQVKFGAFIDSIREVKESDEEISLRIQITMEWQNDLIKWDQSEYGTKYLRVKSSEVWFPLISVLEETENHFLVDEQQPVLIHIHSSGLANLDFKANVRIGCHMNGCLFPNDNYACNITFLSSGFNASDVLLVPGFEEQHKMTKIKSSGTWQFWLGKATNISNQKFGLTRETYFTVSGVAYEFTVQRKPLFYYLTLFIPLALVCVVVFFGVMIPHDSSDRISLLISCLIAEVFYLDSSFEVLPKSSDHVPIIILYIYVILFFTALQIFLSCLTSYFAGRERQKRKMKGIIKFLFLDLMSKIFLLTYFKKKKRHRVITEISKEDSSDDNKNEGSGKSCAAEVEKEDSVSEINSNVRRRKKKFEEKEMEVGEADAGRPAYKECRMVRRAINRLSNLLSLIFVLMVPTYLYLVFSARKKAKTICYKLG